MTSFVVKNNAESTVADNPLAQAATTLNVAAGGGGEFPSTFPFLITLWDESTYPDPTDDSGMEIVKCTGRTTDALTIVRAQEGTADVAHALGERVAMLMTAGILNDATYGLATKLDGIEAGADVTDATNVNNAGAVMLSDAAIAFDTITEKTGDAGVNVETVNLKDGHINELKKLIFKNTTELTIATGVITVTQSSHSVDTEGDAASDDLDTINGGEAGQLLILTTTDSTRDVVLKHGTGNLLISGGNHTMSEAYAPVILIYLGNYWMKVV